MLAQKCQTYKDQIANRYCQLSITLRLERIDNTPDEWQTDGIVRHGLAPKRDLSYNMSQ